jgi:hypothetical protein
MLRADVLNRLAISSRLSPALTVYTIDEGAGCAVGEGGALGDIAAARLGLGLRVVAVLGPGVDGSALRGGRVGMSPRPHATDRTARAMLAAMSTVVSGRGRVIHTSVTRLGSER